MKKYTRIILPVYDMQKSCLKCSFALFKNFRGFGSKMKKDLFSRFLIFQTCNIAEITIISTKMHQRIIWKVIEKQYSLHKAVIKRECGIHCFKSGFE